MSLKARWYRDKLAKKCAKGFRGYPVATVAFYGPDDKRATKVAVGIIESEGLQADVLERWFSEDTDVRVDPEITAAVALVQPFRKDGDWIFRGVRQSTYELIPKIGRPDSRKATGSGQSLPYDRNAEDTMIRHFIAKLVTCCERHDHRTHPTRRLFTDYDRGQRLGSNARVKGAVGVVSTYASRHWNRLSRKADR